MKHLAIHNCAWIQKKEDSHESSLIYDNENIIVRTRRTIKTSCSIIYIKYSSVF